MKQTTFSMILFLLILGFIVICVVVVEKSADMRDKHLKSMIEDLGSRQSLFEEKLIELEGYIVIYKKEGN